MQRTNLRLAPSLLSLPVLCAQPPLLHPLLSQGEVGAGRNAGLQGGAV